MGSRPQRTPKAALLICARKRAGRLPRAFSAVVAAERTLNRALFALALAPAKGFVSLLHDLGDRRHTS